MEARHTVTVSLHEVKLLYTTTFHEDLKVATHCYVVVRLCFIQDQPDTTGSCRDIALWTVRLLFGADCLYGAVYISSLQDSPQTQPVDAAESFLLGTWGWLG